MTTLLDASALLAVLNEEAGAERVEAVLDDVAISSVNAAEVAGKLFDVGWTKAEVAACFIELQLEVIAFELKAAVVVGELRSVTQQYGLSLADRACLATAIITKMPVFTADKVWGELKLKGAKIQVIR